MYVVPEDHRKRCNRSRDTLLVKYGAHNLGDLASLPQVI
jgi:hypothetical protein